MSILSFLFAPAADDVLFFVMILFTLGLAAYLGQTAYRPQTVDDSGDITLVSGAVLSLSGLLIGFMFSLSISGYASRGKAEVREALAIGHVWQYSTLQPQEVQKKTDTLLRAYLDDRIRFFTEDSGQGRRTWLQLSQEKQRQLWQLIVSEATHNPTAVMASVLTAYSELYTSLQETQADWRRQIPDAGWGVLIVFATCASFLSGYQYRGRARRHVFFLLLPGLTALALFMIAEIDLPGEGLIRVTPDDLHQLASMLARASGGKDDPSSVVHHVY